MRPLPACSRLPRTWPGRSPDVSPARAQPWHPDQALAVEEGCQPGRGDGPVGVLAQFGDLGPVQVAVEADADPSPVADIRRPEEPAGVGGEEFVLGSGQAGTP